MDVKDPHAPSDFSIHHSHLHLHIGQPVGVHQAGWQIGKLFQAEQRCLERTCLAGVGNGRGKNLFHLCAKLILKAGRVKAQKDAVKADENGNDSWLQKSPPCAEPPPDGA